MIFFYTATGDLIKQVPEKVYQGSNKANRIWFVCPTGATNVVNVAFKLPDGHYTPKIAMYSEVAVGDLIGNVVGGAMANETSAGIAEVLDKENTPYSVWYYEIPQSVTAFVGKVKVQFSIYNTDETLYSQVTSFDVLPGVPPIQQEEFDSKYDRVMQEIVAINETIQNLGGGGISQEQLDEIASKINEKVTKTDLPEKIYGTNNKGEQVEYSLSSSAGAGKIVIYREDGRIEVADGTSGSEVVNFKQLDKKQDKVNGVDISGTNAEGANVSITPHGVLTRVHFEDIDEEHTAAITPTGLTIGCRRDGDNKYWVLSCEYEDIPEGYSEIVNTPPRTDGALATLTDIANEIAKIVGGADSSYDTLKEIADWIKAHPNDASELASRISSLESGKVDKITSVDNTIRVYGVDGNGINTIFRAYFVAKENTIPLRKANGQLTVKETPEDDSDAASKKYVDNLVGDIETALDSIIAIQNSILGGNA